MTRWSRIELVERRDARGVLDILEGAKLPFEIRRVFTIHGVPEGGERGAHAHRACHQAFLAMAGAFTLTLFDGRERETVRLDRPSLCIHAPPLVWCELAAFSAGAVCTVLASAPYDAADYIHDPAEFQSLTR